MPKKTSPIEIPVPEKQPEVRPDNIPVVKPVPEISPETFPEEKPDRTDPTEIPLPGEGGL